MYNHMIICVTWSQISHRLSTPRGQSSIWPVHRWDPSIAPGTWWELGMLEVCSSRQGSFLDAYCPAHGQPGTEDGTGARTG